MPRRSLLLLVAGAVAGGCSRDAPLGLEPAEVAAPAEAKVTVPTEPPPDAPTGETAGAAVAVNSRAVAIEDALTRLLPALGEWGSPLRDPLLRLQARNNDKTAWNEVERLIDAAALRIPAEHSPDLEALRFEVVIARR